MIRESKSRLIKFTAAVLATGAIYFTGAGQAQAHEWSRPRVREAYRYPVRDSRDGWRYHYYQRHYGPSPWAARWYRNKHWKYDHRDHWRDEWRDYWRRHDRRD